LASLAIAEEKTRLALVGEGGSGSENCHRDEGRPTGADDRSRPATRSRPTTRRRAWPPTERRHYTNST
jgi:hypothetical protein